MELNQNKADKQKSTTLDRTIENVISCQSTTGEQYEENVEHFERRHLRVLSRRSSWRNKVHETTSTMLQIWHFASLIC